MWIARDLKINVVIQVCFSLKSSSFGLLDIKKKKNKWNIVSLFHIHSNVFSFKRKNYLWITQFFANENKTSNVVGHRERFKYGCWYRVVWRMSFCGNEARTCYEKVSMILFGLDFLSRDCDWLIDFGPLAHWLSRGPLTPGVLGV